MSAISGATHLFEEPELWSWWRNWRATGSSVISSRAARAIGVNYRSKLWGPDAAKRYTPISVDEQCEVLSLLGDIAEGDEGKASLHLHAVLGLRDGSVRGGHFLGGNVRPRSRSRLSRQGQPFAARSEQT